jgi:hypothetical protein
MPTPHLSRASHATRPAPVPAGPRGDVTRVVATYEVAEDRFLGWLASRDKPDHLDLHDGGPPSSVADLLEVGAAPGRSSAR